MLVPGGKCGGRQWVLILCGALIWVYHSKLYVMDNIAHPVVNEISSAHNFNFKHSRHVANQVCWNFLWTTIQQNLWWSNHVIGGTKRKNLGKSFLWNQILSWNHNMYTDYLLIIINIDNLNLFLSINIHVIILIQFSMINV